MRYATALFVLAFIAADALAQDPLYTVLRDAQRLSECMKALDAPCVVALQDIKSYQLLNGAPFDLPKSQTRFLDAMRDHGYRWITFDATAPREVFQDGTRLYAFVPYVETSNFGGGLSSTQAYFVALSTDGGETWKFVDARGLTPEQIRVIVPSYSGQPLPPTRHTEGRAARANDRS